MIFRIPVKEYGYGFFPGGDPRDFTPDGDATPEELENHRLSCEAWKKGDRQSKPDGEWVAANVHVTRCQFGLGSYTWTEHYTPWAWLRYVVIPEAWGCVWRWWEWDFKSGALEAWRGD